MTVNSKTLAPVRSVQAAVEDIPGVIGVAGDGPLQQDYIHAVYGHFPLMFTIIALATLILLMRAFRSFTLALKAVLLNLVSMAATFGLLTFFWQEGHGSNALFGVPATGAITFWIPLMIFAFLFGLSMDYEVFILSRIREEYDGAPALGTQQSGRPGPRSHRPAGHQRGADPVPGVRLTGLRPGDRHQGARHRSRRRHPARRDDRARAARTRADGADGPLELVAAGLLRPDPAGPADPEAGSDRRRVPAPAS